MKNITRASALAYVLLSSINYGQDETISGNLSVTGNLEIEGNTASFGTNGALAAYNVAYTSGTPSTIDFSASASGVNWVWSQGTANAQMQLSSSNTLSLFRSGSAAPRVHVVGQHANGLFSDASDRPGLGVSGHYPQLVLMAGGSNDANRGATVMLGSFDSGSSGNHKHWAIGSAGQNSSFLDFGYYAGSSLDPHSGIRNYQGATVLSLLGSGNVGVGTLNPTARLEVAGDVKITGALTTTSTAGITLSDGTTLSGAASLRNTTLYTPAGVPAATVATDGTVTFGTGLQVGASPGAALTPASTAFLNNTLANLGFVEGGPAGTAVTTLPLNGNIILNRVLKKGTSTYVAGNFTGTMTIGSSFTAYGVNSSFQTGFIAKINASGGAAWIRHLGASSSTNFIGLAVDSADNVYAVGSFSGTTNNLTSPAANLTSAGDSDGVIVKYNASGTAQWARAIGGTSTDSIAAAGLNAGGDIIVAGTVTGGTTTFTSPVSNITSAGGIDGVIAKYNASGAAQWARAVGGASSDNISALAVDSANNIIAVGSFSTATLNLASPASNITAAGSTDGFVLKLDDAGVSQWARAIGGTNSDSLTNVAIDSGDNIIVAGFFYGATTNLSSPASNIAAAGAVDGLLAKLNPSGTPQWARAIGGTSSDVFNGVVVDANYIYCSGYFAQATTNIPAPATNLTGSSQAGMVVKFNGSGAPLESLSISANGAINSNVAGISVLDGTTSIWGITGVGPGVRNITSLGTTRIPPGPYIASWSGFGVVTPAAVPAAPLTWGGGVAQSTGGIALGSTAYAGAASGVALGGGIASASGSLATGSSHAANSGASALGQNSYASGFNATALGGGLAKGNYSLAIGTLAQANGSSSLAFGSMGTTANGNYSIAFGGNVTANGHYSLGMGSAIGTGGDYSFAFGRSVSAGSLHGFAAGEGLTDNTSHAAIFGRYNVIHGTAAEWVATDDAFVLGNGTSGARSNALIVRKNGNLRAQGDIETKGAIRAKVSGDISMGAFTSGPNPAHPTTGLNAGLRYSGE